MTRKHFIKTLVGLNHRAHAAKYSITSIRDVNYNTLNKSIPSLSYVQKISPFIKDWSDFLKIIYDAIGISSMDDLK